jgi:ABC-type nitrate/sulfonate/bicarbonate transport system substrate-binding protein
VTCRRTACGLSLLGALSLAVLAAAPPPSTRTPLKVLYGRYLSYAPLAIASAEGFFAAQGLDVELVHLTGSSEATPVLMRGGIDVSAGMIKIADFNAIARGAALRIVADKGHHAADSCVSGALMARKEFLNVKNPDSAEHLRGARAASIPLLFKEYVLETFLDSRGLRPSDLNVVKLQEPSAGEALMNGSIDFGHLGEPYLSHVTVSGRVVVWKSVQEILPGAQTATVLYGPSLLGRNRDAGRKFMVAYLQGVRQYNRGKIDRNVEIISKETDLDPDVVRKACWESIRGDGMINLESVLDFERWAVKKGALDAVVPPEKFWDPSFVEEAVKILGPPAR